jgi:hypothetical protein
VTPVKKGKIDYEYIGIGSLLRDGRLRVPPNQRSYKWEEEHVSDLFQDLAKAVDGDEYFLGTVVLTGANNPVPEVDESAADYVALFNPEHSKWNKYKTVIRAYVRTIYQELKVEQIRPLLFAISRHFSPEEAVKAFRLCVNWSVRFLIAGGRGGFNIAADASSSRPTSSSGSRANPGKRIPGHIFSSRWA